MRTETDLDYLKAEQDRAFRHKQDAWQAQDHTWHNRRVARDSMDRAHHAKQDAYQDQQQAWEELQRLRERNGSRIDHLNGQQEAAYQNMKDAFERASAAYEARDGVSARTYADEGHRYKAETQEVVSERRMLIQEIRDTRANHEAIRPTFNEPRLSSSAQETSTVELGPSTTGHEPSSSARSLISTRPRALSTLIKQPSGLNARTTSVHLLSVPVFHFSISTMFTSPSILRATSTSTLAALVARRAPVTVTTLWTGTGTWCTPVIH